MERLEELKKVLELLEDLEKKGTCEVHFVDGDKGVELSMEDIKEILKKAKTQTNKDNEEMELAREFVIATLKRNDFDVLKAYDDFIKTSEQAYKMTVKLNDAEDDLGKKLYIYTECLVVKNAEFISAMMNYKGCTPELAQQLLDKFFKIKEEIKL